jgi:broad specificity phosphatase PhoE
MVLLIRHALVDACGRYLAGRMPGIHLNAEGRQQAAALACRLAAANITAVFTSPLERACETAAAVAIGRVSVTMVPDLNEIDFGDWTGLSFDELNRREEWIAFNRKRSAARIPGGERMIDVQLRACRALTWIHDNHRCRHIAVVSHGDVLRSMVANVIGAPLDGIAQFTIDPASVTVLEPAGGGFELTRLNCHAYRDDCCTA